MNERGDMRLLRVAMLALFVQGTLGQQPSATIQGTVVENGTTTIIPGATVEIRRAADVATLAAAPLRTTVTDGEGKFYFPGLSTGSYRVNAIAGGYVRSEHGQRRLNGPGLPIT